MVKIATQDGAESLAMPTNINSSKVFKEQPPILEKIVRDYRIEAELDVLSDVE